MSEEIGDAAPMPEPLKRESVEYCGLRIKGMAPETRLWQIGGGGRIRLESNGRIWWTKLQALAPFEVYEPAVVGQIFSTRAQAERAAANLNEFAMISAHMREGE